MKLRSVFIGSVLFVSLYTLAFSASYGVYVYHIEAENIGEKIGKVAIVK